MRIMYLLFSFTTGGTERLTVDICNAMVQRKHTIYLYIINDLIDQNLLDCLDDKVQVQLQNRKASKGDRIKTILNLSMFIRKNKIEIVHCNSFQCPELLFLKGILFRNTKIYYTIHGMGQYDTLKRIQIQYRNRICRKIIAISKSVKEDIIFHGADKQKVELVYNAINLKKFVPFSNSKQSISGKKIVIGNIARIAPELKGQDILIRAVAVLKKRYPDILCLFAGEADNSHKEAYKELRKMIQNLGVSQNIQFLGNISDVPAFLREIDIFVLPSRLEGFGISLIEAMAMGIPCIATNLNGPAEILQKDYGLLFTSENAEDLAVKIDNVIQNYVQFQKTAQKARYYVRKQFNIDTMCNHLLEIYVS